MTELPEPKKRSAKSAGKQGAAIASSDDEWAKLTQHEKFVRTARELECDESSTTAADEALKVIGRARRAKE